MDERECKFIIGAVGVAIFLVTVAAGAGWTLFLRWKKKQDDNELVYWDRVSEKYKLKNK